MIKSATMTLSPPLLFLNLLADRKLNPGAVMLGFGSGNLELLSPLIAHADFVALAAEFPCLIGAKEAGILPPGLLAILQDKGCQLLYGDAVYQSDEAGKPVLPPGAQWLSGGWCMTPPPKPVGSQTLSRAMALKLVQLVAADADTREIEEIFRHDPSLSYQLLRIVNSLSMGTNKKISSFSQAILLLGRQQLRRWLNLMLFAARKEDPRSAMLLARVSVRARSMEMLAKASGLDRSAQELAFMAGMFSLLGILFGQPLTEVLKPLQVSDVLVAALLKNEGDIGHLLQAVESAERGDADGLATLLAGIQLPAAEFNSLNIEAHRWMLGVSKDNQGGARA
jgi:hypothetical protein